MKSFLVSPHLSGSKPQATPPRPPQPSSKPITPPNTNKSTHSSIVVQKNSNAKKGPQNASPKDAKASAPTPPSNPKPLPHFTRSHLDNRKTSSNAKKSQKRSNSKKSATSKPRASLSPVSTPSFKKDLPKKNEPEKSVPESTNKPTTKISKTIPLITDWTRPRTSPTNGKDITYRTRSQTKIKDLQDAENNNSRKSRKRFLHIDLLSEDSDINELPPAKYHKFSESQAPKASKTDENKENVPAPQDNRLSRRNPTISDLRDQLISTKHIHAQKESKEERKSEYSVIDFSISSPLGLMYSLRSPEARTYPPSAFQLDLEDQLPEDSEELQKTTMIDFLEEGFPLEDSSSFLSRETELQLYDDYFADCDAPFPA